MPTSGAVSVHRRSLFRRRGNTLWSVRTQLLAPIIVATAGLIVLGSVQTANAIDAARDAERARVLAETATATVRLVHEVERELAETAALRQRGGKAGELLVIAQRQRVDSAADKYQKARDRARQAAPALGSALGTADTQLGQLSNARAAALTGDPVGVNADPVYYGLSEALLAVADALPAQLHDTQLANAAREIAAVAAVEHYGALERDLLRGVFARGIRPGELSRLSQLHGAQQQRQAEFARVASGPARNKFNELVVGTDVANAARMRDGVLNSEKEPAGLKVDADAWYVAQSGAIRRLNLVGLELSNRLNSIASDLATTAGRRAWATGLGTGSVALLALIAAVLLAVRTSRRLRQLRAAALAVANQELPATIEAVSAGKELPDLSKSASAAAERLAKEPDEIGQVADAFASVHRTARNLAAEQAELRVDVARMAEVLARRIRTLITRQLRLLDEFEREETDPDALSRLFALDHLAARLRRNGENLLVLAGGEPGRPYGGAYPLAAVVSAAASEIEEFARVEADVLDVAVSGAVVGDLVHLLAELLENAANFSPPNTSVRVDARRTIDGMIVRVHDSGIGISPGRLAEVNERLAAKATLTSAAAGTMGLYVVAHLAARHRITVQLHGTGTGTVAYVELPNSVLATAELAGRVRQGRIDKSSGDPSQTVWFQSVPGVPGRPPAQPPNWPVAPVPAMAPAGAPPALPPAMAGASRSASAGGPPPSYPSPPPEFAPRLNHQVRPAQPTPAQPRSEFGAGDYGPSDRGRSGGGMPDRGMPDYGAAPDRGMAGRPDHPMSGGGPGGYGPPPNLGSGGVPPQRPTGRASAPSVDAPVWSGVIEPPSGSLPRRQRGAQLAPETPAPVTPVQAANHLDPDLIRSRLSALAEGVSAALRRSQSQNPTGSDS